MTESHALTDLGIDLSDVLSDPAATVNVSTESVTVGFDAAAGTSAGAGIEVEFGAPGGVPQLSVEGGGQVAAEGGFQAGGSYDSVDLSSEGGTTEVTIDSVDAGIAGGGSVVAGAEFDFDVYGNPDGGLPAFDAGVGVDYAAESELHTDAGYSHTEISAETGGYGADYGM
jgi:hypothetical protein